jgi:hypothetical protein
MRARLFFTLCVAVASAACSTGDHELTAGEASDAALGGESRRDAAGPGKDAGGETGDSSVKDSAANGNGSTDGSVGTVDSAVDGNGSTDGSVGTVDSAANGNGSTDGSVGTVDSAADGHGSTVGPCVLDTSALDHCLL